MKLAIEKVREPGHTVPDAVKVTFTPSRTNTPVEVVLTPQQVEMLSQALHAALRLDRFALSLEL